jgi:aspartate aminotransferase
VLRRRLKGAPVGDATRLAMYLLEEAHLATVSGDAFGAPGHLRLSYATSRERIEEGMRRLADALTKLA